MDGLDKALDRIIELVRAAECMAPPREPHHVYYTRKPDGTLDLQEAEPRPVDARVGSLQSLVAIIKRYCTTAGDAEEEAVVMVGPEMVLAVLDENRRHRATWPLTTTDQWVTITTKLPGMRTQADLVNMMRVDLHGCVDPAFLAALRSLRFTKDSNQVTGVDAGRDSIALSAKREVAAGGQPLPEETTLQVRVFDEYGQKMAVRCGVIVDLENARLGLRPLAGQIADAMAGTLELIAENLRRECKGLVVLGEGL